MPVAPLFNAVEKFLLWMNLLPNPLGNNCPRPDMVSNTNSSTQKLELSAGQFVSDTGTSNRGQDTFQMQKRHARYYRHRGTVLSTC